MAQHKDIDRASALLEGVQGWHIEYHPESISKYHINSIIN